MTGNFDNWSQNVGVLTRKDASAPFSVKVPIANKEKLVFKFVINGDNWTTSENYKAETDEHGNLNNFVDASELEIETEDEVPAETETEDVPAVETVVETAASTKPEQVVEPVTTEKVAPPVTKQEVAEPENESVATPVKAKSTSPNADTDQEDELFTRVLTSESSYASVSLVSSDSAFEHVSQDSGNASNRNAPEELTPTTSLNKGKSEPKGAAVQQLSDSEVTTIGPSSRNNSFTGGLQQSAEVENISKGLKHTALREPELNRRRDGLMNKLRGLFRS